MDSNPKRPKLKITWDLMDWVLECMGLACLVLLISTPAYYYADLPDSIPTHFNAAGEADGFSNKSSIWSLPILGWVTYSGMFILNRFPHIFNYPTPITAENAAHQYRIATKLIRSINFLIAGSFWYIVYSSVTTAIGESSGLGTYFLPIFLGVIFGTIGIYLVYALKK